MYKKLIEKSRNDPNIIGLILFGSRGMGKEFIHKESDYDLMIIVKDKAKKNYYKEFYKFEKVETLGIDFTFKSEAEIKGHLEEWQRDTYARIKILVDKTNWLKKYLNEISKIPKSQIKSFISGHLDGYINYVYRSLKCWRDNNEIGARLEANRSIEFLLKVAFALHDRRTVAYYKYIKKDLNDKPLKKFKISSEKLLSLIKKIIDEANVTAQKELLNLSEKTFKKAGYGMVFDSWGEKLKWIKKFQK